MCIPVSYTHLDVYKRQVRHHVAFVVGIEVDAARTTARSLFRTERTAAGIILAVLLHWILDVYKRQRTRPPN